MYIENYIANNEMYSLLCQLKSCITNLANKGEYNNFLKICKNNKIDFNYVFHGGNTLLSYLAAHENEDNIKIFKYLMKQNINKNAANAKGSTPILIAAASRSPVILKYMLKDNGFDFLHKHSSGANLLHLAMQSENIQIIEMVLKKNKSFFLEEDNEKRTPFLIALKNIEVVKYLLRDVKYEVSKKERDYLEENRSIYAEVLDTIEIMENNKSLSHILKTRGFKSKLRKI